jgi:hypothetical protein
MTANPLTLLFLYKALKEANRAELRNLLVLQTLQEAHHRRPVVFRRDHAAGQQQCTRAQLVAVRTSKAPDIGGQAAVIWLR